MKDLDLNKIVREAIKEKLEDEAYELICNNLPTDDLTWWAEKVCTPVKDALINELKKDENQELLKDCFEQVFADYFDAYDMKGIVQKAVESYVTKNIKLPKYKITVEQQGE